MSTRNPSVIYESQTLTEEQKATVCENIGAQPAVSGKSLSTNDYTNEDQSKLQGIEAGADVNTIESISVDGTAITPDANKDANIPLGTDLTYDSTNGIQVDTTGTATGSHAFVEGANTTANGNGAHAEGVDSEAVCQGSHAGGYGAHITGLGCFGHGTFLNFSTGKLPRTSSEQNTSEYEYSGDLPVTVLGTLNATQSQNTNDHGGYLLIVGNGNYGSGGTGTRSDGFILHKDGTVKATAFQNASGTDNNVGVSGGAAFSGISNIEVFAATGAPNPADFPNDNVLRIILES